MAFTRDLPFVLVGYLCVIWNLKANRKPVLFFKAFLDSLFGISTFLTLETIQTLMSPLLNVSDHNSTQCLCLGLQHSAAWCLYSGKYLLFISKGQFVNKPEDLLRNGKRSLFNCVCLITLYSANKLWLVFKWGLRLLFFSPFSFWTELLANFKTDLTEICYLCINQLLHYDLQEAFYCRIRFVFLLHTYLLIVLQNCDFTSLIVVVLDL